MTTTDNTQTYDITIVGAGLVGASLACALAREHGSSLRIAIIEAGPEPRLFHGNEFDPRVVALTKASQQFLSSFGAWALIANTRLCPYTNMYVWDGEGTGHIHFDCHEVQQSNLGHIVENSVAVHAIHQQLHQTNNITLLQSTKVENLTQMSQGTARTQLLLNDGRTLQSQLVIAADGANSLIRQLTHFKTREWDYGHKAIVTTVQTEKFHQYTAWQRFNNSGPLAFLPLQTTNQATNQATNPADNSANLPESNSHYSSIVWSAEDALADDLMSLDNPAFCAALGHAFEHKLGNIEHSAKRFCFPLRQRHATDYVRPGIALVGDAAHTIHPLAGQGVNLGLLDAAALTHEIHRAIERGIPLTDYSILRRYQRQRLGSNLSMMTAMEGFKRLFGSKQLTARWVRNEGMTQINNMPMLKKMMINQAMGFR